MVKCIFDEVIDGYTVNLSGIDDHVFASLEDACVVAILHMKAQKEYFSFFKCQLRRAVGLGIVTTTIKVAVHKTPDGLVYLQEASKIYPKVEYTPISKAAAALASLLMQ